MADRFAKALIASALLLLTTLTGCAPAPQGAALYRDAEERFLRTATTMHDVLMAIHVGDWTVPAGGYGAVPIACRRGFGGDYGYRLSYSRYITLDTGDAEELQRRATEAFARADVESYAVVYGTGDRAEWNVIAKDASLGRLVVTITPSARRVEASANSPCVVGNAEELSSMIFDVDTTWRSLPAFEGPASIPLFFFPADGPLYFHHDGTPIEPQPVVTTAPVSPWSTPTAAP